MQFRRLAILSLLLLLPACGARQVRKGDELARKGDWERALEEYRAAAEREKTNAILDKIVRAEREVATLYVNRGLAAGKEGKWGEAGEWWSKALALRPNDARKTGPKAVITQHAAELERYGDEAIAAGRFEDAFRAWDPLLRLSPSPALTEKSDAAHKRFAADLDAKAAELSKQGLVGAALIAELRVLRHDPLHPTAYERTEEWRKALQDKHRVAIDGVTVDDRGWWGIGDALRPRLEGRLGEYPPYGPTKSKSAIPGAFVVTIEEFTWFDRVERGYETRRDAAATSSSSSAPATTDAPAIAAATPAPAPAATPEAGPWKPVEDASTAAAPVATPAPTPAATPAGVANPEHLAQKRLVDELERELAAMEKVTAKEEKKGAKRLPTRIPVADDLEAKRKELDAAKAKLASLPERIDPALAGGTWTLPYKDVTRTVHVKVRFEVREPDMPEPISIVRTAKVEAKDRTHSGDAARAVEPDHLELPKLETLVTQLAGKLVDGTDVIRNARDRRVATLVEKGRAANEAGRHDEAIEHFVAALFVAGPNDLPAEARSVLTARVEGDRLSEILK